MKENLEKVLKNIKNLNVRNHFKTTVALLTMSSVLALTGCNGIRRANTDDIKNKAAYETEIEEETKETIEEVQEKEETEKEKEETKEEEVEEEATEELSEFDKIDLSAYEGYKLEEALQGAGYKYSFDYRKQIAEHFGIENYKGTASQNLEILEKLGAKVTVDTNTSNKTDDKKDNKTGVSAENKENQDNKNAASETTTPATPGASSSAEDEKSHGHSGNHGNSGDKKPTNPEKPVDPSKPDHVHAFNNWHSKDDQYEEGECSCGEKEIRKHKYNTTIGNYTPNHNGTHSADVTDTCINCGHVVSKKDTADCNYTTIIAKDDTNETKQCACGDTIDVAHVWDEGVLDSNNNTVYTCTNPGCGYSYKVEHHIVEETKEKKSQADLCRIINGVCTIPGCGKVIYTIEDREHDFFVEKDGLGLVPDKLKCHDCDYRTEDPNFVPSTPVIPPMPDDEDEEEINLYNVDSYVPEVEFVEEIGTIEISEEPADDVIYSTPDCSDDYMEIINAMEEAILPKEDKENVEEESAENVLKLSL